MSKKRKASDKPSIGSLRTKGKNSEQLLQLHGSLAILKVGDKADTRPCQPGELELGQFLVVPLGFNEHPNRGRRIKFVSFHVTER